MRIWTDRHPRAVRELLWSALFLASALLLAFLSTLARNAGQHSAALFLALFSLLLALLIAVTLLPRLLQRVQLDFLDRIRFFRITRRGAFFVLLVAIIAFSTINTGNNLLILVLSLLLASLLVSGMIANLVLYGLKISLNLPESIHAGQKALLFVTLHNLKKRFPSFALQLRGHRQGPGDPEATDFFSRESHFPYVRAGRSVTLKLSFQFRKRGIYPVGGFEVRTSFPFGFFTRGRLLPAEGNIRVYPELVDLKPLFLAHPYLQGPEEKNRRGLGTSLYNIRDYQRGDDARFVHWKSTAKLGRLMVKDSSQEEETPLRVVLSTHLPQETPQVRQQFEWAVSCVTSLASYYWRRRQSFSFSSGEFQISVNGEREHYEALMDYLAYVGPSQEEKVQVEKIPTPAVLFAAGPPRTGGRILEIDYLNL